MRALAPFDAAWLHDLHSQAFETPWSAQSFMDLLAAPTVTGWTVEAAQGPGFIMTQHMGDQGEILTFQVARAAQGAGLGSHLLRHAMDHLRTQSVKSVFLEVAANRLAAKKLYENQGFKIEGLRKLYYKTRSGRIDAEVWALHF